MNIIDILMCPECKSGLSEDLKCKGCHNQYNFKDKVFDVVSRKLSYNLLEGPEKPWVERTRSQKEMEEAALSVGIAPKAWYSQEETEKLMLALVEIDKNRAHISEEYEQAWQQLYKKFDDFLNPLLNSLSGTVCDLATGLGGHLERLLNIESKDFNIVCIDICKDIMPIYLEYNSKLFWVAADARYMSIKDNSFDYITSHGAFDAVAECDKVAKEMYRTLKPHGKLIVRGAYVKKDSKSFEIAKSMNREKGILEEYLIQELENAGFKNIVSTIVAQIRFDEQEDSDMRYCYVIQAEKF